MVEEVSFFAGKVHYLARDKVCKLFEANHAIAIEIKLGPQSSYIFIRSTLEDLGNGVAEVFLCGLVQEAAIGHEHVS